MKPYAATVFNEPQQAEKKDIEHQVLRGFLERLGFSEFHCGSRERPDFIIDLKRGETRCQIACEITELYSDEIGTGSEMRRFRERWKKIMKRVRSTLQDEQLPYPYCVVDFVNPSYGSLQGLSDDILIKEFVTAGQLLKSTAVIELPHTAMPCLNSIVRQIRVINVTEDSLLWWPAHMQSGQVPDMGEAIVASIIDKCTKALDFDWQGVSHRWLLLVAEGQGITDLVGPARDIPIPSGQAVSPFTAVWVWDRFTGNVWTIFPEFAVAWNGKNGRRNLHALPPALRNFSDDRPSIKVGK